FQDAAADWSMFANLTFVERTSQANYVVVQNYALPGGLADLGMIGGQQNLRIGTWDRLTLDHEIGHTLGLVHEFQRSDRDTFVTIFTNNVRPGFEYNFVLLPSSVNRGPYDFLSVMHYGR